jgi:hypothetical protein
MSASEFASVSDQAIALSCNVPTRFALLPRNFERAASYDELRHEASTNTFRKLLRQNGLDETPIERDGSSLPHSVEHALTWLGPIIFVTAAYFSERPQDLELMIRVASDFADEYFRGFVGTKEARLTIVVETNGKKQAKCQRVDYSGPPEGLQSISETVRRMNEYQ